MIPTSLAPKLYTINSKGTIVYTSPGIGHHPHYVLTAQLATSVQVLRLYVIGPSENIQAAELLIPATKEYGEEMLNRENYLLWRNGGDIDIYVRGPQALHKLEYRTVDNVLEVEWTHPHPFRKDFSMEVDPFSGQLIHFGPLNSLKEEARAFSFGVSQERIVSLMNTQFEAIQWQLVTFQAVKADGQLRLFALLRNIVKDQTKLAVFSEQGLLTSQTVGIWNDKFEYNPDRQIIHVFEENGSQFVQNFFLQYSEGELHLLQEASANVGTCSSHPHLGRNGELSIYLGSDCEIRTFNYYTGRTELVDDIYDPQAEWLSGITVVEDQKQNNYFAFVHQIKETDKAVGNGWLTIAEQGNLTNRRNFQFRTVNFHSFIGMDSEGYIAIANDDKLSVLKIMDKYLTQEERDKLHQKQKQQEWQRNKREQDRLEKERAERQKLEEQKEWKMWEEQKARQKEILEAVERELKLKEKQEQEYQKEKQRLSAIEEQQQMKKLEKQKLIRQKEEQARQRDEEYERKQNEARRQEQLREAEILANQNKKQKNIQIQIEKKRLIEEQKNQEKHVLEKEHQKIIVDQKQIEDKEVINNDGLAGKNILESNSEIHPILVIFGIFLLILCCFFAYKKFKGGQKKECKPVIVVPENNKSKKGQKKRQLHSRYVQYNQKKQNLSSSPTQSKIQEVQDIQQNENHPGQDQKIVGQKSPDSEILVDEEDRQDQQNSQDQELTQLASAPKELQESLNKSGQKHKKNKNKKKKKN